MDTPSTPQKSFIEEDAPLFMVNFHTAQGAFGMPYSQMLAVQFASVKNVEKIEIMFSIMTFFITGVRLDRVYEALTSVVCQKLIQ